MPLRPFGAAFVFFATVLIACPPPISDDDDATAPLCDNEGGPEILVQEVEDEQPAGFPVQVAAQVTDPEGVSTVSLYYMTQGGVGFSFTFMSNDTTGDETVYVAEIPASIVDDPGVDYYVRATDSATSGCQAESFAPADGEDAPFHFTTSLDVVPIPFTENFDPGGDCESEGYELDDIGWEVSIQSFPQGIHAWRLDDRSPLSGNCSASHSEGIPGGFWECPPPDGNGTIVRQNWLISPPLDFSGKSEIAVRWFERRVQAAPCAELHQVYISTSSPNPAAGAYELVEADVPLPGSSWSSSAWYDLSPWAGEEQVYVALYYEGGAAGRWQVDDLYIGEPLADLQLEAVSALPPGTAPDSSGVEFEVTLRNASDLYSSAALSASLTTANEHLTVTGGTANFAAMDPGATAAADSSFVFDIASSQPDNAWLDFALVLDDGASHVWTVPIRLLMGEQSTFTLDYEVLGEGPLGLELGYGPVVSPDFAISTDSDVLLGQPWTLDLTEEAAALPPGPGPARWHVKASNDGLGTASVDAITFTVGGLTYTPTAGDVPVSLDPGTSVTILVPPPPLLVVESYSTSPDPAAPGGAVSVDSLVLRNDGHPTSSSVACVMGSSDPSATGFSSTPVAFGSTPMDTGESRGAGGSFSFDIDASHVDNSDIPLTLLCTDGADTLVVGLDLAVPYAHPVTDSVRIDDSASGNGNELADAGEVVDIYLPARNDGAFATDGALTATYSIGSGSTAGFNLSGSDPLDFGSSPLGPGASIEASNAIQLALETTALLGDTMVLDLVYTAGSDSWAETLTLEVTGLDWLDCPYPDDAEGDAVNDSSFDIQSCAYRSDGTLLQVRVDSYTPFSPPQAFVDFFFYEIPSTYSIESVGGNATLESGCVFGDDITELTVPVSVDVSSGTSATARIALEDLAALGNNTQVAFGAGSCPDIYFCDAYPSTALSFNIENGTYNCDGNSFIPINW
ncbi:MAG: hypothetical protein VX498_05620 [Myxococcota bacterium]|nr:hypothetical protein [Myxococcota bacterium]